MISIRLLSYIPGYKVFTIHYEKSSSQLTLTDILSPVLSSTVKLDREHQKL